jgi:uncharacterized protein YycO
MRPGDVLLYTGGSFFARVIQFKTWSRYSHVEIYDGNGGSVASRDGVGVGRYPLRVDGLRVILRPLPAFDPTPARAWFNTVNGQPYDWFGLLAFTSAKRQGRNNWKMFCSEFAARYLRAGGVDPFNGYDADGIAPGEFMKSAALLVVWRAE